jgi:integrase/recombinase XerD
LVPISEETRRLLLTLISADGKSEYVFLNERGNPLTRYGVYWIVRGYMRKAGIQPPKLGSHRLRHSFGRGYLINGGDVRSLQLILGHADIRTTQKYASLNITDLVAKHHTFTTLRPAHAAAQESFLDKVKALEEAEAIVKGNET